ncbi:MAG: hypothetical protein JWM57_3287 [Phycisphaerales bacterium]|nr:hypothetical protein [Phycisphaerales bacterium]
MKETARIIDYSPPPTNPHVGARYFFKQMALGALLGLLIDAAVVVGSVPFGSQGMVVGIFAWVLVPLFLIVFGKRIAMAAGVFFLMPVWPFVAYVILMLSSGITC